MKPAYGKELILDLHECNPDLFTRKSIRSYLKKVCLLIDMERCKLCWWDDLHTPDEEKETEPHMVGTSVVQFIKTSNITIHTLDLLGAVYVNIFSCKDFDHNTAAKFTADWFNGVIMNETVVERR
jgi:S-adenosylmethionine/arginine decarboxylase-like enzyme